MITVIKKNSNKKKKEKDKEKNRIFDETRTWDLFFNIKLLPLGHVGSLAFTLQKALI